MTAGTFIRRSLRFHWRSHLGVLLGATVATLILVGALAVGDSVRHSLTRQALLRLGTVHFAVNTHDRFFREELAAALAAALQAPVTPVIAMPGLFSTADGRQRVNHLQVIGADARFRTTALETPPAIDAAPWLPTGTARANGEFARRVPLAAGATTGIVRVEKPAWLPRDAPASSTNDASTALRVTLAPADAGLDRFSLQANQVVPPTVTVALPWLQKEIEQPGRANVLLIGQNAAGTLTAERVNAALRQVWALADADLTLAPVAGTPDVVELRTDRVFLETPITAAAIAAAVPAEQVLTYFVNELRVGSRATPYSFVAATDHLAARLPAGDPRPLAADDIILNAWLANDLEAKVGDTVNLKYYVTSSSRALEERTAPFRVRAIVPVDPADLALTPKIAGLSDKENCRDWDPGTTIHLDRIRPQDEAYWEKYRGTPKAFVSLAAGAALWSNRFGDRTALRWPAADRTALAEKIRTTLDPVSVGLFAQPVRAQALQAAGEGQDFGGLFIGLSFFLIVAALLLTGLLFAFGVEQRSLEIGTLLAVGWTPRAVRRVFLGEGLALAALGAAAGTCAGLGYTRVVLQALNTQWRGAIAGAELWFHVTPLTLVIGAFSGVLTAGGVIWFVVRRAARLPARDLLAGRPALTDGARAKPGRTAKLVALAATLLGLVFLVRGLRGEHSAEDFFGAGGLLLIAGLAMSAGLIRALENRGPAPLRSAGALARQNVTRRRGRSLATIALLACGSFLVIAVGANRHDPSATAAQRSSGTGGFAFFGESTLPVHEDPNDPTARESLGLPREGLENVRFVGLRLREGDDASCLNLNRAQSPRLLAVDPRELASRGAFTFIGSAVDAATANPWLQLDAPATDGAVPAIGDEATVRWALGKKVGDTLAYTDERGRTFPLRIVGMIANSVLQGSLVVGEKHFIARFPTESGRRIFLVDAPAAQTATVAEALTRALRDYGLELQPAAQRLALFQQVENTYLAIFAALGGLGLLLGSIGLGVVVLRNALERRSELALLRAVGFTRGQLRRLLWLEHGGLLALGLACGVLAALVAVFPTLRGNLAAVPWPSLVVTLAALLASGALWIWLAAGLALRGHLLRALRNE